LDPSNYAFAGGTCSGAILAPGAQCTALVRFTPRGSAGIRPSTVVVGFPGVEATASLTGTALTPGALTLAPSLQDFDQQAVGSESAEAVFTIHNTGSAPTGTLGVALSSAASFAISSNHCPATLAAGEACTVGVVFAPKVAGVVQGVTLAASAVGGGSAA